MPFCPKCEEEYREGFEVCADCDVALVEKLTRPEELEEVEEQHAQELFEDDRDHVRFCISCMAEFVRNAATCVPCGDLRLYQKPRDEYEKLLTTTPLDRWPAFDEPGPEPGLVRVLTVSSPADSGFVVESLESMGIEPEIGHDGIDDFEDASRIGIYVQADEVEAAKMLLPDDPAEWEEDEDDQPRAPDVDPFHGIVAAARSYHEIRKYRHARELAVRAIERRPDRWEGYAMLGTIAGAQGFVAQAAEAYDRAVEVVGVDDRSEAGLLCAVFSFLEEDGGRRFGGERGDRGMRALKDFSRMRPRSMATWQLLLEAAAERGEDEVARDAVERMRDLNARVLELPGKVADLARRFGA